MKGKLTGNALINKLNYYCPINEYRRLMQAPNMDAEITRLWAIVSNPSVAVTYADELSDITLYIEVLC